MSGVELAGLVLAVIPLVISALEDYNEGLDPVKAFVKWDNYLPQYIRKLRNQHVHYEQTIRLLLSPITTEYELAEMVAEPNGELWKDADMAKRLELKLGEAYHAYHEQIKDAESIMQAIAAKLDLDRAATVSRNDLEAMLAANGRPKAGQKFEFRKRVKFTMNKKKIKRLLDELDGCNRELERFTEKSEKLEPWRKNSKPSLARKLQKIQSYARILHHTLLEAFSCSCRASHLACLHLEHRDLGSKSALREHSQEPGTIFTVSFADKSSAWAVSEAQICFSEEDADDLGKSMSSLHLRHNPRRSVSFSPQISPTIPKPSHSPSRTQSDTAHHKEIRDLCSIVRGFDGVEKHCIGLSMENGRLRGAYPVPLKGLRMSRKAETVTLADLLNENAMVRLRRKERYMLACTVASSILQLHASPWISDKWSKKDIMFYCTLSNQRPVDIEHPHVKQKVISETAATNLKMGFKNTTLLSLGITLLELALGSTYEKQIAPEVYMGHESSLSMLSNAYEWYQAECDELSAAFQGAISHCLRCFGDPSASLQDPLFLQSAIEQIVLPLHMELDHFLGTR